MRQNMAKKKLKYAVSSKEEETDILPNKLNLSSKKNIEESEFAGFLNAEHTLFDILTSETKFNIDYIKNIHKRALEHLYDFAGKYRTVNISKQGFLFPSAMYLEQSMKSFEEEILDKLPDSYTDKESLIKDIAKVHAEFLYIHPFREGNGRTARLLANIMSYKAGYSELNFDLLKAKWDDYVIAVQKGGEKDYTYMEKLIRDII